MTEFTYDLRDLKFILKEWLNLEEILNYDRFQENYTLEDVDFILNEAYKIAKEIIYPLNREGDKIGVQFENGVAKLPPGYKKAYKFLQENGWGSANESIASDAHMPLTLYRAYHEMFMAACPALCSYIKLTTGAANLIYRFGTERDKKLFLGKMLSGQWSGTMCLTEPHAGSDVGEANTRAYPTDDPRIYKIKGTKMFITGGEVDITENIIHMVLARPAGGAPGTKGLGLYIVPKIWVNEDGSLGEPNDVTCIAVEQKMGLKASATAMLSFGDNDNCRGILVGDPPDREGRSQGLAMMFHMMNESRIGTGHNALAQMAAAYYFASRYAAGRIQGRPFTNPKADRVPIIEHEDVRRMLMEMKSQVEGIRAMIFKGFYYLDVAEHSGEKEKAKKCRWLAEILTPLIKTYASETAWPMIAQAIQVHGGVGYTEEYPVSQYARDVKILTIWEGTSFIQAMDLVGRKMRMEGGRPFAAWLGDREEFIAKNKKIFQAELKKLEKAYECVVEIKRVLEGYYGDFAGKGRLIPLYALRVLHCCAQLFVAECLLEQAIVSKRKIEEVGSDCHEHHFYAGKIASAKYFIHNILPNVYTLTEIIKCADASALECPEESFLT
ncbi:MAG: acyl-CoA dehydrogenase [Bacillota bacterium]